MSDLIIRDDKYEFDFQSIAGDARSFVSGIVDRYIERLQRFIVIKHLYFSIAHILFFGH